jgi:type IV pilus assembly protein PilX
MSHGLPRHARPNFTVPCRGVALVVVLLLITVLACLTVTGLVTAVLELRMAANLQSGQHAFEAAEFGIERALLASPLSLVATYASPEIVPAGGGMLRVPGTSDDWYAYCVYRETSAAATPAHADGWPLRAYHFVVVATGRSAGGAIDTHVQGFFVLGPDPSPDTLAPPACTPGCADPSVYAPHRTYWRQEGVE